MISHSVMLYTAVYILASEMYKPKIKHLFISVFPYLIMTVISLGTSLLVWDYEQIDYNGMVNGVNIKFVQDVMSIHPAFFIFMYLGALTLLASIILGLGQCFTTPKKFPTQETTV